MNVCIGTIDGKSVAYISDMPGVNPEFMPEGIHKLIAFIDKERLDKIATAELKALAKYCAKNANIFNWCIYKYEKREILAKYDNGNEGYFTNLEDFVATSEGYSSVEESEEAPEPSSNSR